MSYNQQYLVAAQMGHQQVQVQTHQAEIAHQQAAQLELAGGQPTNTNALAIRRPFDPRAHDLDAHFRLTRFADLKGWGCKVPQEVLLKLLEGLQDDANSQEEHHFMHMAIPRIGKAFHLLVEWLSRLILCFPTYRHWNGLIYHTFEARRSFFGANDGLLLPTRWGSLHARFSDNQDKSKTVRFEFLKLMHIWFFR